MKAPVAILFANLKGNIGDFAILHSMLQDINAGFPGHPVHVYRHGFHPVDEERTNALAAAAPHFHVAGATFTEQRPPGRATARLAHLLGLWPALQGHRISALANRAAPLAESFGQYEAVFLAGGAQWTGSNAGVSMFATLRAVHTCNQRIFGYPFSVYPSVRKMNRLLGLREDLSRIRTPLIARDSASKAILGQLGVRAVLGADCVYSLQGLAKLIEPVAGRHPSRVILAFTGQTSDDLESAVRTLCVGADTVALLTTCEAEDGAIMREVAAKCGVPFLAPLSWQETVAEMKASALVVTNRLHGLIFGSFTETPLLPLTDRRKTRAFADDARVPLRVESLPRLDRKFVDRTIGAREEILAAVGEYRDRAGQALRSPLAASVGL